MFFQFTPLLACTTPRTFCVYTQACLVFIFRQLNVNVPVVIPVHIIILSPKKCYVMMVLVGNYVIL